MGTAVLQALHVARRCVSGYGRLIDVVSAPSLILIDVLSALLLLKILIIFSLGEDQCPSC